MSQINARIRQKRDTAANWTNNNPVLLNGELIVVETSTGAIRLKVGDGVKTFNQLPFLDEVIYNTVDSKIATELSGYATLEQAKVFLVTFSEAENGTIAVDKTIQEIITAYEAGRMVFGVLPKAGFIFQLSSVDSNSPSVEFICYDWKFRRMLLLRGGISEDLDPGNDFWSADIMKTDSTVTIRRWFEYE